jgi:hypothetical protein
MMSAVDGDTIRPADPDDRPGIIRLAVRALGWRGDERDEAFFAWKHDDNPFGPSPAWVATDAAQIIVGAHQRGPAFTRTSACR